MQTFSRDFLQYHGGYATANRELRFVDFANSAQSTLGIEWELALVDDRTGAPAQCNTEIVDAVVSNSPDVPWSIVPEFMLNTIELVTDVASHVADGIGQLADAADKLMTAVEQRGLSLYSQGTHPLAYTMHERVTPKPRYEKMLERTQWWGQQQIIFGLHVHVGVDHIDKAMPAINHLVNHYGHFLALSASSPLWESHVTGFASQRAQIFQQLPTSGLPFQFERYADFQSAIDQLIHTGVISDVSEARWDLRPVPRFGTVEVRICDSVATLEEIGALTALTQCLVHQAVGMSQEALPKVPILQPWHVQENKWRASRYGLDADIIINQDGDELPLGKHINQVVDSLMPIAEHLRCADELEYIRTMVQNGSPASRTMNSLGNPAPGTEISDERLGELILASAAETRSSIQRFNGR